MLFRSDSKNNIPASRTIPHSNNPPNSFHIRDFGWPISTTPPLSRSHCFDGFHVPHLFSSTLVPSCGPSSSSSHHLPVLLTLRVIQGPSVTRQVFNQLLLLLCYLSHNILHQLSPIFLYLGNKTVLSIPHNIRSFMAIEIQHFSMLGEMETFMMEPMTSGAEADPPRKFHVEMRAKFRFKISLQPNWNFFLHKVHSIGFCSFWKHLLCTEITKSCRVDGPFVR